MNTCKLYTLESKESVDGGYIGTLKEAEGVMSQGETIEELTINITDALMAMIAARKEESEFKVICVEDSKNGSFTITTTQKGGPIVSSDNLDKAVALFEEAMKVSMLAKVMLKNKGINYCPNCKEYLSNNKKLAQGVKECLSCKTRFHILITSN